MKRASVESGRRWAQRTWKLVTRPCRFSLVHRRTRFLGAICAIAAAVGAVTQDVRWNLQLNLTRSLPVGVYRRIPGAPTRGDFVVACLPPQVGEFARSRGYVWRGDCPSQVAPVGK